MSTLKLFSGFLMAAVLAVAMVFVFPSQAQPPAGVSGGENKVNNAINFVNVPFNRALGVYTQLCGMKKISVDADEAVKNCTKPITFKTSHPLTLAETLQVFEVAFQQQAGIAVMHVSTNQVVLRETRTQIPVNPANDSANESMPPGMIDLRGVDFLQVFTIYTSMCRSQKIEVEADESVKAIRKSMVIQNTKPVTALGAIQLFEDAFQQQAGIEVTHPSTNQVVLRLEKQN